MMTTTPLVKLGIFIGEPGFVTLQKNFGVRFPRRDPDRYTLFRAHAALRYGLGSPPFE